MTAPPLATSSSSGCFWSETFALHGSVTPMVLRRVVIFGVIGLAVWMLASFTHSVAGWTVTPFEFIGVVLGLLLVLRTNSGYDRWYEARKLWGGIVNQSRNLAILGTTYGPRDERWQREFAKWTAAFPHIARHSLRGERQLDDIAKLLGGDTPRVAAAQHMPCYVAARISRLLLEAVRAGEMNPFAFHQAEKERLMLIDHIGACERILKTPLATAFSIEIRRYLFVYLATLPLALVDKVGVLTPLFTMLIAYPLLSLDQIGVDLQNPFSKLRLSHLPLDEISSAIECNVLALLEEPELDPVLKQPEFPPAPEIHDSPAQKPRTPVRPPLPAPVVAYAEA